MVGLRVWADLPGSQGQDGACRSALSLVQLASSPAFLLPVLRFSSLSQSPARIVSQAPSPICSRDGHPAMGLKKAAIVPAQSLLPLDPLLPGMAEPWHTALAVPPPPAGIFEKSGAGKLVLNDYVGWVLASPGR